MAPEPLPLFSLPDAPAQLVGFRYSSYDIPFWVRANSRDGRWNVAYEAPTQYWSLTPDAAWAELIRHENLTSENEIDLVRMPIWTCRVSARMILDLRTADARDQHGITEAELIGEDWGPCQALSQHLRTAGTLGVISPSAALPGHDSLTLFGPRRPIEWRSSPALASAVPAALVAIGRPPRALVENVRRRAMPQEGRLF